jgi:cell division protein FtsQ
MPAVQPRLRLSRRTLLVAVATGVVLALAYLAARETPLFAVRTVEVAGAPPEVEAEARAVLGRLVGTSLVAVDPTDVEARVEAIPWVRSASADRAFPHTLSVRVRLERALGVVSDGARAWLVAESGRVVAEVEPSAHPHLARIRTDPTGSLRVGSTIRSEPVRATLSVLRAVPRDFPARILEAGVEEGSATLVLRGGVELRLGTPEAGEEKLRAAAAVLRALDPEQLEGIAYVDVSVPGHTVTGANSQPES